MSVNWDRAWDSQGNDGRDWSPEFEERFEREQPENDSTAAAAGAQEIDGAAGDQDEASADSVSPSPCLEPEVRSPGPADAAQLDASEFDFSSGIELSRRPLGWNGKPKGRALVKPDEVRLAFSPHEQLLILDTWQRSGLPAGDVAPLVGMSKHTSYLWKKRLADGRGTTDRMDRRGSSAKL